MTVLPAGMYAEIAHFITKIDCGTITPERRAVLQPLIDFIQQQVKEEQKIRLHFICTHNSRRSHLAQIWAQTMAFYFNINKVYCYSAGTESTAVYPMISNTLAATGFQINAISKGKNPVYCIKFTDNEPPIIAFSKKLDDSFNPKFEFAAVMTCSEADGGCPFIFGAEKRFPITYEDPKIFDGTSLQNLKYSERNIQIASEFYYIFSKINLQ